MNRYTCPVCGTRFMKRPRKDRPSQRRYCSLPCARSLTVFTRERVLGDANPTWKGGRYESNGYTFVYVPDHPNPTNGAYVQEHRLVMERELGRYLEPHEIVHHKDGNKQNNDPSNLELTTRSVHIDIHRDQLLAARRTKRGGNQHL